MYQGRYYLMDAGPNIMETLKSLGIDVGEIEGIFHTHSHDDHFAGLPALQTTVATILAVPPVDLGADVLDAPLGDAELRCLVRIATTSDRLSDTQAQVVRSAEDLGAHVQRLDGEQAPAVYATAPTGGGRW